MTAARYAGELRRTKKQNKTLDTCTAVTRGSPHKGNGTSDGTNEAVTDRKKRFYFPPSSLATTSFISHAGRETATLARHQRPNRRRVRGARPF